MDKGKAYYGPDGNLYVWTGEGYHMIPGMLAGSDVGDMTRPETITTYQQGDSEMSTRDAGHSGWGISNLNPYTSVSGLHPWTQFMLKEGGTQDAFSYLLKSADKEGTRINYVRQPDGSYKAVLDGAERWDTNANSAAALGVVAAPFLMAGAQGMLGAAGNAAGGATGAAGQAASALNPYALTAADFAATSAPASAWGATGAAYIPGTYAASPFAGIVAGEGGAATLGSTAASLAGSLPASTIDLVNTAVNTGQSLESVMAANGVTALEGVSPSIANQLTDLAKKYGPDILSKYGGDIIKALSGAVNASQGEDAVDDLLRERIGAAGDYKAAYGDYAEGLKGLLPGLKEAYDPKYATADNGFATSYVDPVTGKVGYNLNAPYAAARNQYFDAAGKVMGQAQDFNPQTFAVERFNQWQGLLAPQREQQMNSLISGLRAKGQTGLSVNSPTQDGIVGLNPLANSFAAAWAQSDKEAAYRSLDEGEKYLDNLLNRQKGLFGQGANIDTLGQGSLSSARDWSSTFTNNARTGADKVFGTEQDILDAYLKGDIQYIRDVLGARERAIGSDATRQTEYINAGGNIAGDVIKNMPWKDIFNGLFGTGG